MIQFGLRGLIVRFRVRELHRPGDLPEIAADDPLVLSVVRNGMAWLHTFLLHHRERGARRFVILDNGSTDGTREYLAAQADVILLGSTAPYRHYENTFKRYLCDHFGKDRWCLFVDVDELASWPGDDSRDLRDLCRFAEGKGFNAVLTQMLDLYSGAPMAELPDTVGMDLRMVHSLYETRSIAQRPYPPQPGNVIPPDAVSHSGGVRLRVFGTRNGLTKISLFRNELALKPFHHWHHAINARIADFSIALLHYPFNRQYREKVIEAASSGRYGWLTSDEYEAYAAIMRHNPGLVLKGPDSEVFAGPEVLVAEGFLKASPAFADWAGIGLPLSPPGAP